MQFGDKLVVGFFQQAEGGRWVECNTDLGSNVLRFEEKRRQGSLIEMLDVSRDMWVRIDLNGRRIYWSTDNKRKWNYIYDVTATR